MTETRYAICPLCDAICGIAVDVEGGRIAKIRGDEQDPFSRGYICPKAVALKDIHEDPDRVRRPLRRDGDRWQETSWEEALDAVAEKLVETRQRHGKDAVAFYIGNPTAHSYAALLFGALFKESLGTRNYYSSSSVDALPRQLASALLYGNQATIPVPDLDRTRFLLMLGANPVVSNGCTMTAPDVRRRLLAIKERGGRLVVIDPRRSETAEIADQHHFIRPGTDALLLSAMIRTVLEEGLSSPGRLAGKIDGQGRLRAALAPFDADAVSLHVGIDAETIRALARDFARSPAAAAYGRMGTTVQEFGTTASWLIDVLNIVTGNLDREGGAMFTTPAVDLGRLARLLGMASNHARWRSRVGGLPEFNGETPVAALADEMETEGEGQIRAFVTHAGNPVLSLPNGRRLDRALQKLDFMVSMDLYVNETTRHAHWILPTSFGLERDHYPLLFHSLGVRNTAHYAKALLPVPEGVKHDGEIFLELVSRMGKKRGRALGAVSSGAHALLSRVGPKGVLKLLLRLGGRVRLEDLESAPHGVDLGALEPRIEALLATKSGKIEIAPEVLVGDLERLRQKLVSRPDGGGALSLIGRRSLRSNNSWMHNSLRLVKGPPRCTLMMHPTDAAARGLGSGARAVVASATGEIEAPVEVSSEVMPGVVSLPHGYGHDRPGIRLSVAGAHAGVSVNDITEENRFDAVSGTSALNGVPVTVRPAAPSEP